jgi:hypothetical protein
MILAQPLQCCRHVPNQWLASFLIFANLFVSFANCSCRAICLSKLQYCGTILQCCLQENIQFDCKSDPMLKIAIRPDPIWNIATVIWSKKAYLMCNTSIIYHHTKNKIMADCMTIWQKRILKIFCKCFTKSNPIRTHKIWSKSDRIHTPLISIHPLPWSYDVYHHTDALLCIMYITLWGT